MWQSGPPALDHEGTRSHSPYSQRSEDSDEAGHPDQKGWVAEGQETLLHQVH